MSSPIGILAVKDVPKTANLFANVLNWKSAHGGTHFDILVDTKKNPMILLHKFDEHDHKRFSGIKGKSKGVGHSSYVFVKDIKQVYKNVKNKKLKIVEPLFLNENSGANEFTFQIEEGYQFSVCDSDKWLFYSK